MRSFVAGLAMTSTLVAAGAAYASGYPATLKLAKGTGGPEGENGGPGNEQATVELITKNGVRYLVTVYMSSDVSDDDAPWQGKCTSIRLNADDSPSIVVDRKQISAYHGGDRLFNHPILASTGEYALYGFGSDGDDVGAGDQANVQFYVGAIDEMCNVVVAPIRFSEDADANEGAADIKYQGNGYFTAGYLSQGADDNDVTYALGLRLSKDGGTPVLEKTWGRTEIVTPADVGRPTIAVLDATHAVICAAQGDNRPPEDGVRCAVLDGLSGDVLASSIVAASDPDNHIYMNQPSLAMMQGGRVALQVIQSNGAGAADKDTKGTSLTRLYVYDMVTNGGAVEAVQASVTTNVGSYQSHSSLCSGSYGLNGELVAAQIDASITGVGLPAFQVLPYDAATKKLAVDKNMNLWIASPHNADSGYLANIYGQNPNTQG